MKIGFKNHADKARFIIVGAANTAIDFSLLFLLTHLGLAVLPANIISTTTAFSFSFVANRNFTFRATGGNPRRQLLLFFIVTLFGLWVLQPIIIELVRLLIGQIVGASMTLLIGKIAATIVTLTWNYTLYRRFVFKKEP